MAQPAFNAMDCLEFPELHEDSVGVLAFTRNLYKLMAAAGVSDFSLKACRPERRLQGLNIVKHNGT